MLYHDLSLFDISTHLHDYKRETTVMVDSASAASIQWTFLLLHTKQYTTPTNE